MCSQFAEAPFVRKLLPARFVFCFNQVKRCDLDAPSSLGSLSWRCKRGIRIEGRGVIPTHLCVSSQDAPAGRISSGKGCGLGVSGVPQDKAELHQSYAKVVGAGGNHLPHAEAIAALVHLRRSHPHSFSIHLLVPALGVPT